MNSDRDKQKERYAIMIMKMILRNQRLKRRAESLENKRQRQTKTTITELDTIINNNINTYVFADDVLELASERDGIFVLIGQLVDDPLGRGVVVGHVVPHPGTLGRAALLVQIRVERKVSAAKLVADSASFLLAPVVLMVVGVLLVVATAVPHEACEFRGESNQDLGSVGQRGTCFGHHQLEADGTVRVEGLGGADGELLPLLVLCGICGCTARLIAECVGYGCTGPTCIIRRSVADFYPELTAYLPGTGSRMCYGPYTPLSS